MLVSLARQLIVLVPVAWALAAIGQQVGNDDLVWLSFPVAEVVSSGGDGGIFHPPEQKRHQQGGGSGVGDPALSACKAVPSGGFLRGGKGAKARPGHGSGRA